MISTEAKLPYGSRSAITQLRIFLLGTFCATLGDEQYLKVAVLAMLYGCVDVTLFCCREVDLARGSSIGQEFLRRLNMAAN